jgi:hypothetical protein
MTPVTATAVPHPLAGRGDCMQCHAPEGDIRPAPQSHAGLGNDTCLACHQPPKVEAQTATPAASPTPIATVTPARQTGTPAASPVPTPAASPLPTPAAGAAIPVPHPAEDHRDCLRCHDPDSHILPAPPNHRGLGANTCFACHALGTGQQASPGPGPTLAATPTPALTHVAPTPEASPAATSSAPPAASPGATITPLPAPAIPHDTTGVHQQCWGCHAQGVAGAPVIPANHAAYTNDECGICHRP